MSVSGVWQAIPGLSRTLCVRSHHAPWLAQNASLNDPADPWGTRMFRLVARRAWGFRRNEDEGAGLLRLWSRDHAPAYSTTNVGRLGSQSALPGRAAHYPRHAARCTVRKLGTRILRFHRGAIFRAHLGYRDERLEQIPVSPRHRNRLGAPGSGGRAFTRCGSIARPRFAAPPRSGRSAPAARRSEPRAVARVGRWQVALGNSQLVSNSTALLSDHLDHYHCHAHHRAKHIWLTAGPGTSSRGPARAVSQRRHRTARVRTGLRCSRWPAW